MELFHVFNHQESSPKCFPSRITSRAALVRLCGTSRDQRRPAGDRSAAAPSTDHAVLNLGHQHPTIPPPSHAPHRRTWRGIALTSCVRHPPPHCPSCKPMFVSSNTYFWLFTRIRNSNLLSDPRTHMTLDTALTRETRRRNTNVGRFFSPNPLTAVLIQSQVIFSP